MRESSIRALSGFIYIVLLLTATLYSEVSFTLLFGIFLLISIVEFCKLIHLKNGLPILLGLGAYTLFVVFRINSFSTDLAIVLATLFVSVNLMIDLFGSSQTIRSDKSAKYVKLFGYIILPFVLLMKLPFITNSFNPEIIIGIFILIWTNDTFAYIVGKSIGKTKLFERISPKKTIEGFVGGLVFTMVGSYVLSLYFTFFSPFTWIMTGLIVGFFGTIGDLIESRFKRTAGVKDSGKIMPGHGGILDRLDSVIFAIPFLYLFYQILNYVS